MMELVIDASVVLKWYLKDEEWEQEAFSLLEHHVSGSIALHGPALLPYEVLNALIVAERMGRIAGETTEKAFEGFMELDIELSDPFADYPDVLSLGRTFQRSIYDASYLSLAKNRQIDLVTGDRRLYQAVTDRFTWVKWIGDMRFRE